MNRAAVVEEEEEEEEEEEGLLATRLLVDHDDYVLFVKL